MQVPKNLPINILYRKGKTAQLFSKVFSNENDCQILQVFFVCFFKEKESD